MNLVKNITKVLLYVKEYLVPIVALFIPWLIHVEGKRFSETQLAISKQQFYNDIQTKYLEIFYNDLTSGDSVTRAHSVSLLRLMNDSLAGRLGEWVRKNPNISDQIKQSVGREIVQRYDRKQLPKWKLGYPSDEEIESFLMRVYGGKIDAVKAMLSEGFPTSVKNDFGEDAMIIAVKRGDYEMFDLLRRRNANLKTTDSNGYNLLHIAISADNGLTRGHLQITTWLVENGFNIKEKTKDGTLPLMLAVPAGENSDDKIAFELMQFLLKKGADPCINDVFRYRGSTPRIVSLIRSKCPI